MNKSNARRMIQSLRLEQYSSKAVRSGQLRQANVRQAETEYRQFLLLLWVNQTMCHREMVVPTELADAVWHQHILDTAAYRRFCTQLVGKFIDHSPGLKPGTQAHSRAVTHTRDLQREHGSDGGFMPTYLAACSGGCSSHGTSGHASSSVVDSGSSHGGSSCGGNSSCGGGGGCGGGGCGGG